jgi:cell division protein YceG involved in septum cleavage
VKEIIIVITILFIIIGGSIYTKKHIEEGSDTLTNELEELKEEIKISKEDSREKIIKKTEEIQDKWEETNKFWSAVILHNELDMIETSLTRMESEIVSGSLGKATEELDVSVFLLDHLVKKETLSLRNIF